MNSIWNKSKQFLMFLLLIIASITFLPNNANANLTCSQQCEQLGCPGGQESCTGYLCPGHGTVICTQSYY